MYAHLLASGALGVSFLIATQFVEDERQLKVKVQGDGEELVKLWGTDLARRHVSEKMFRRA